MEHEVALVADSADAQTRRSGVERQHIARHASGDVVDLGVPVTAHPSDAVTRCGFQDQVVVDDLDIFIERCHRADAEPAVLLPSVTRNVAAR